MNKILFLLLAAVFLLSACEKRKSNRQDEDILDYLEKNGITDYEKTEEGVYVVMEKVGTGDQPTASGEVTVHYEGSLLDGTIFDSSIQRGVPSTFFLTQVISGWQIGIPYFKEGGEGFLLIPSRYAYGANPPNNSPIGKNDVLVFRIELIEVL